MVKRILFLVGAFALLLGLFVLVFPVRSFFPTFFLGAPRSVLIVYDEPSSAYRHQDMVDAYSLRQLLGHFNTTVRVVTSSEYQQGMAREFSRIFYVGSKPEQGMPSYLIEDLARAKAPVFWIGANLWLLLEQPLAADLGFHLADQNDAHETNSVLYKDKVLWKKDPATYQVVLDDPRRVKVWAQARTAEGPIPWIVQSGRFWYAASNPFSYAIEGSCYLAFCDLLHDFIGQPCQEEHRAMVRIEDIHAMRDPEQMRAVADYLAREEIPFGFTLTPVYLRNENAPAVYLSDVPEVLDAIRYMIRKGGVPVLHGYTHQRVGETAVDHEFWSGFAGGPRSDDTADLVRTRMRQALLECFEHQIYPLAWTTPHYAASQLDYSVMHEFFTTAWERRQPVDLLGSDQFFPYLIKKDMHNQILLPESLGFVTADETRSPEALVQDAENTLVVRDGYASFFFHPFLPLEKLQRAVEGIRRLGYRFVGLTEFNNVVSVGDRVVLSGRVEVEMTLDGAFLNEFTVGEDGSRTNETFSFQPIRGRLQRYITMAPGRIKVMQGVRSAPPLTPGNLGKFRPSLTGITNPVALFFLFSGIMILILFLAIWVYLLLQKTVRTARRRDEGTR